MTLQSSLSKDALVYKVLVKTQALNITIPINWDDKDPCVLLCD